MLFSPNDVLTSKWPQKTFLQGTFTQHCKFGRGGHIQRPRSGWKLLWELLRSVHDRKILTSLKLKNRGHLAYPNFLKIKKKHQKSIILDGKIFPFYFIISSLILTKFSDNNKKHFEIKFLGFFAASDNFL